MPWVCASTYPRTSWYGVTPACGLPSTSTPASGNGRQPVVRSSRKLVRVLIPSVVAPRVKTNRGRLVCFAFLVAVAVHTVSAPIVSVTPLAVR